MSGSESEHELEFTPIGAMPTMMMGEDCHLNLESDDDKLLTLLPPPPVLDNEENDTDTLENATMTPSRTLPNRLGDSSDAAVRTVEELLQQGPPHPPHFVVDKQSNRKGSKVWVLFITNEKDLFSRIVEVILQSSTANASHVQESEPDPPQWLQVMSGATYSGTDTTFPRRLQTGQCVKFIPGRIGSQSEPEHCFFVAMLRICSPSL